MLKNNYKSYFIILIVLFVVAKSIAQQRDNKQIFNHSYLWGKVEATEIFEGKTWGIGADVIHRRGSGLDSSDPLERGFRTSFRPWMHFQIGSDARVSVSPLSYHHTRPYLGLEDDLLAPNLYELRSTVQFFHHLRQQKGKLMHTWRYRLEFRNRTTVEETDFRHFFRLRLRYRFRYMINEPDFYQPGVLYAVGFAELGLNMGNTVVHNIYNQNRFYLAIGRRFFNTARLEIGYIDRFRTRGPGQFDHGRGLMLSLTIDQLSYLGRKYTKPLRYAD